MIVLATLYAVALAGVQVGLSARIAGNRRGETLDVVPALVPGADRAQTRERVVRGADGKESRVYQARDPAGRPVGWVLPGSGQGFADRIELLVGLDAALRRVTGLWVLEQKETPGLGDSIVGAPFRTRFAGKTARHPLRVIRGGPGTGEDEIAALTGATVSSESVSAIVNDTVNNLREAVAAAPPP